jgi:hypothetical protein
MGEQALWEAIKLLNNRLDCQSKLIQRQELHIYKIEGALFSLTNTRFRLDRP